MGDLTRLGETESFKLRQLDAMVRAGECLGNAVDSLDREGIRALADRFDVDSTRGTAELRRSLKRHLVGSTDNVRQGR